MAGQYLNKTARTRIAHVLAFFICAAMFWHVVAPNRQADAHYCGPWGCAIYCYTYSPGTKSCLDFDCPVASAIIRFNHSTGEAMINQHIDHRFPQYRAWLFDTFFKQLLLPAMMQMTEQLSAVGMYQMLSTGILMDAKTQLETQRLFQELRTQAVKDYQPSEDFCAFGTGVRTLSHASSDYRHMTQVLNRVSMARNTGERYNAGSFSSESDKYARWRYFAQTYCAIEDNNFEPKIHALPGTYEHDKPHTGLSAVCYNVRITIDAVDNAAEAWTAIWDAFNDFNLFSYSDYGSIFTKMMNLAVSIYGISEAHTIYNNIQAVQDTNRTNIDVSYPRALGEIRTVDRSVMDKTIVNPIDDTVYKKGVKDIDLIEMSKNLYGHNNTIVRSLGTLSSRGAAESYLDLRAIMAKRSVAQNSFNHLAAMKIGMGEITPGAENIAYIKAIFRNLGMGTTDKDFKVLLGENPSYYAQLEVIAKRLYQNQTFFSNLYDTPENIERTKVALRAIELMIDRETYESRLRQEMLASVLLSSRLEKYHEAVNDKIDAIVLDEEGNR